VNSVTSKLIIQGCFSMTFNKRLLSASGVFVHLLCFCIAGLLFAADPPTSEPQASRPSSRRVSPSADKPEKTDDPNFVPGEEVRIDANNKYIGGDHFLVYVPADYTDEQDWPVIFVYHGMNAQPTTWPFRQITGGKGFIVIGMGYVQSGEGEISEGQYINYIKRERRSVLEVKRYVSERLRIDEKRLFVTGYSRGGWHTSAMLESSAKAWAGAVIFAAGRSPNARLITTDAGRKALRGKPIYIGAGEKDVNLASAKRAVSYYEKVGAKVTFEEYKGAGHGFDPTKSEILYNWLVTNSSVEDAQSGKTD
jgi:predicted esterase